MNYTLKFYQNTTTISEDSVKNSFTAFDVETDKISAGGKKLFFFDKLVIPQISIFTKTETDEVKVYAFNRIDKNNNINLYEVKNEKENTDTFKGNVSLYFGDRKILGFFIENNSSNEVIIEFFA